jgi:hypothetical protein
MPMAMHPSPTAQRVRPEACAAGKAKKQQLV